MHKNSQKRFYDTEYAYFITVKTHQNFLYFQEEIFCNLWIEELRICKKLKKNKLYAFCLLHNHFHMVLKCHEKYNISQVMQAFKKNFSQDANKIIEGLPEGENSNSRLQGVDLIPFRQKFFEKHGTYHEIKKFKWQQSFHDHVIRNETDFENHINYTIYNFAKHEYPENWKWTSLNFPELLDEIF